MRQKVFVEKLKEAAASVLPVSAIVAVLCLVLVPVDVGLMLSFLFGSALLILGMGMFTLGAEVSMTRIGNLIGARMTKSKKLWFILVVSSAARHCHYDGGARPAGACGERSGAR